MSEGRNEIAGSAFSDAGQTFIAGRNLKVLSMDTHTSGKQSALELCSLWEGILEEDGLSSEVRYRLRKLIDRTRPMVDKMFVKTLKGREMIVECANITRTLQDHVRSDQDRLYVLLTHLETVYEDFLTKTYEFRVKAG